ncbi:hypothetical protein GEMRC1_012327 [Eukaryota sp. GEM-RC1]
MDFSQFIPKTTNEYFSYIENVANNIKHELDAPDGFFAALVLGSGLNQFAEDLKKKNASFVKYDKIGMPPTGVEGHIGAVFASEFNGKKIMCFAGRFHAYEGYPGYTTCFLPRLAAMCGCRYYIATNAAGGSAEGMQAGDIMAITDHINATKLSGQSEVLGDPRFGTSLVSGSQIYSKTLLDLADTIVQEVTSEDGAKIFTDRKLFKGTYMWSGGPSYETFAEVRRGMAHGASAYGMSTVPEAIAAHAVGLEVFGLSLISNLAAGISPVPLAHAEVVEAANEASVRVSAFMTAMLEQLPEREGFKSCIHSVSFSDDVPIAVKRERQPGVAEIQQAAGNLGSSVDHAIFVSNVYGEVTDAVASHLLGKCNLISSMKVVDLIGNMIPTLSYSAAQCLLKIYNNGKNNFAILTFTKPSHESVLFGLESVEISLLTTILRLAGAETFVQFGSVVNNNNSSASLVLAKDISLLSNHVPVPLAHPSYLRSVGFDPDFPLSADLINPKEAVAGVGVVANVANMVAPVIPTSSEFNIAEQSDCNYVTVDDVSFVEVARNLGGKAAFICSNIGLFDDAGIIPKYTEIPLIHRQAAFQAYKTIVRCVAEPIPPLEPSLEVPRESKERLYNPHELCFDKTFVEPATQAANRIKEAAGISDDDVIIGLMSGPAVCPFKGVSVELDYDLHCCVCKVSEGKFIVSVHGDLNSNAGTPIKATGYITRVFAVLKVIRTLVLLPVINSSSTDAMFTLVSDHVNIWQDSALWGHNDDTWGARFPDMSDLYTLSLRQSLLAEIKKCEDLSNVSLLEDGQLIFHFGTVSKAYLELVKYLNCSGVVSGRGMEVVSLRHCGLKLAAVGYNNTAVSDDGQRYLKKIVELFAQL